MNSKFLSDEILKQKRSSLMLARRSSIQSMRKSFCKPLKSSDQILMQGFEIFRKKKITPEEEKTILPEEEKSLDLNSERTIFIQKLKKYQKSPEDAKDHFTNTQPEAILSVCKQLCYEIHPISSIIFKENDDSNDKFYIILSGKVGIISSHPHNIFQEENKEEVSTTSSPLRRVSLKKHAFALDLKRQSSPSIQLKAIVNMKLNASNNSLLKHRIRINEPNTISSLYDEAVHEKIRELGEIKDELAQGESFGEKALLSEIAKRTATILALTPVEFLILKKSDFIEIMHKFNKEKEKKQRSLFKVLPFLKSISSISTLENLMYSFKEEIIILGLTITNENEIDKDGKIYFLVEGRCRVGKMYNQTKNGLKEIKDCMICEVADAGIVGEEILENNRSSYKYTVTVVSDFAVLYYITKANLLMKFPREVKNYILENFQAKESIRDQFYEERIQKNLKSEQENCGEDVKMGMEMIKNESLINNMTIKMRKAHFQKLKDKEESEKPEKKEHSVSENEFWNGFVDKIKDDIKMKSLTKLLRSKKMSSLLPSENSMNCLELMEKINYDTQRAFFSLRSNIKNKRIEISDESIHDQENEKNETEVVKFNFGYAIENKQKEKITRIKFGLDISKPEKSSPCRERTLNYLEQKTKFNNEKIKKLDLEKMNVFRKGIRLMSSESERLDQRTCTFNTLKSERNCYNFGCEINNVQESKTNEFISTNNSRVYNFYDHLKKTKKNRERLSSAKSRMEYGFLKGSKNINCNIMQERVRSAQKKI